jgi:hypothetical protein
MNIITDRLSNENRAYVWYDCVNQTTRISLTYDMIPEPKIYSDDYIKKFKKTLDNGDKKSIFVKMLIKLFK